MPPSWQTKDPADEPGPKKPRKHKKQGEGLACIIWGVLGFAVLGIGTAILTVHLMGR